MFETDYLLRIIHQFVKSLARVLLSIQSGNTEQARSEIQRASEEFLGLPFDMILSLNNQSLSEILGIDGERSVEKSYIAAQLLFCEASVREAADETNATELYLRSVNLLLGGFSLIDETLKSEAASTIDQILLLLQHEELPLEICKQLVAYHELRGEYSSAEDRLFELSATESSEALEIGVSFYERILSRTDDELERGNLPRSEVEEGLEELRARFDS